MRVITQVTDKGRYRYSLNQLFITWQKPRALKIQGASLRAHFSGLGLWFALFPPSSPSPLAKLAPQIEVHLTARGMLWSIFVSVVVMLIPWRLLVRPLPIALPHPLKGELPSWVGPLLWRSLRVLMWQVPLLLVAVAGVWVAIQSLFNLTLWPLYWAQPSLALLPSILLGLGARLDKNFLKTRASRARFVEQFQRWHTVHPLTELLDKPRMQVPHPEFRGGLYNEDVRKILIVDQDLTVDILAKNGLHKQGAYLLLSLQGYPEPAAKYARRLLALHPKDVEVYVLHNEQRDERMVTQQLRALGVTPRHKMLKIGWTHADLRRLIANLGFKPVDWGTFTIDTLSPKSLLEGVVAALAVGVPVSSRLRSGGGVIPAPSKTKPSTRLISTTPQAAVDTSDPQLEAFLTPEPLSDVQGSALQTTSGDDA